MTTPMSKNTNIRHFTCKYHKICAYFTIIDEFKVECYVHQHFILLIARESFLK